MNLIVRVTQCSSSNNLQNVASNPQVVTRRDASRWTNLEFPLHIMKNEFKSKLECEEKEYKI